MFNPWRKILDPNTRRRLARFGRIKRAKWSLIFLIAIFVISLFANFLANDKPLLLKANGRLYIPVLKFYPENAFAGNGVKTRPRYKELEKLPIFTDHPENWMLWPLIRYGPEESLAPTQIEVDPTLTLRFAPEDQLAAVDVDRDLTIQRSRGAAGFYGEKSDLALRAVPLESRDVLVPPRIREAILNRFQNVAAPAEKVVDDREVEFSLGAFSPTASPPKLIRLSMERRVGPGGGEKAVLSTELEFLSDPPKIWDQFSEESRTAILAKAEKAMVVPQENFAVSTTEGKISVSFTRETVEFPFRPVKGHALGLDNSGRDVGVRIFYATRTALAFGILLVIFTFVIGIFLGAIQGYFGGWIDMSGQRLTEIWESMPFLLIMILLSSIYGRSFLLLGFVYGIFNWIGISYYVRAEFLRLRKLPFVEAARVMGIGRWKIMFRHIFPNALVPIITFFPFSLVGSIFVLTALDYLGFGLPPGTPSWGNLLDQGQSQTYAWWLTLYPSLALFLVSLLGIFIGEGVRAAFDPRTDSKLA
ncbi:MAG: ABC transporter permease subunit [Verrucomicrobiales bacterium]|jgi:microcin C transport system permease protein|nr:ABC transporter permease subunit [Verrucomicrobiales bacterium]MBP9223721.1 ABC transporter permease subunit [Verrucomicrobiales bacterium]